MSETVDTTKELGTRHIGALLWKYALPAVITQIIATVYNLVDSIFLGHSFNGPLNLAALAILLPIMNIIHAFGSLVGAGASSRMSIVLGRKDVRWAEKILGNSMVFTIILAMPIVEVKIVKHRPFDKRRAIRMKMKFVIDLPAKPCNVCTMVVGGDPAVLSVFLHLLHVLVCLQLLHYCVKFSAVPHFVPPYTTPYRGTLL